MTSRRVSQPTTASESTISISVAGASRSIPWASTRAGRSWPSPIDALKIRTWSGLAGTAASIGSRASVFLVRFELQPAHDWENHPEEHQDSPDQDREDERRRALEEDVGHQQDRARERHGENQ